MVAALQLHLNAFARLSQKDRALIDEVAGRDVHEVEPRCDVIREGDSPRGVNLMLEGWACRYKQLADGRRQILHFFIAGDLCDPNVFVLKEMDHSIGAITRLRYAEISPADFQNLMLGSPRIAQVFWWMSLVNVAIAREWTTNVGQRSAYERIAHLFCEMHLRLSCVGLADNGSCDWPLTQNDIGDATGLTAVHVNRTLQELRRAGLIELHGKRLTIHDLVRLRGAAKFNDNYLHLDREGRHLDAAD